jgi:hypothetical protein
MPEEVACDPPRDSFMELKEGKLSRAVDDDEQLEPSFRRVDSARSKWKQPGG